MPLQEITKHFGAQFMCFLERNVLVGDTEENFRPAPTLPLDMPWEERAYVMEYIDALTPDARRQGGRTAYLAFFGSGYPWCWEAELGRVDDMLDALGM